MLTAAHLNSQDRTLCAARDLAAVGRRRHATDSVSTAAGQTTPSGHRVPRATARRGWSTTARAHCSSRVLPREMQGRGTAR